MSKCAGAYEPFRRVPEPFWRFWSLSKGIRASPEGFQAFRNIMMVHSPPSTSLGTRQSDADMRNGFLEVIGPVWRASKFLGIL
jgi:hypothetical protein